MKKFLCVLVVCLTFGAGLLAAEESDNHGLERPIRLELGYSPLLGVDFRGAYMFPINDVLRWDVGMDMNVIHPGPLEQTIYTGGLVWIAGEYLKFGTAINFLAHGSFWWWDFYATYGLGLSVNTLGGVAFIPFDLRIGWEPGALKNNRVAFKLETALFGTSVALGVYKENGELVDKTPAYYTISPRLNIGVAVRL
ncbi:MAG: hypothetical protein PUC37_02300 [Spirochaetales bacterium]|nr:hypothetical protein [Spirochaetales bacterium]